MRTTWAACGLSLLVAIIPAASAEARTPSKAKAERFLEARYDDRSIGSSRSASATATCAKPRSTRRSRSTRCVISASLEDRSTCVDDRVTVRYRSKRSMRMRVTGVSFTCTAGVEQPPPTVEAPPAVTPPFMPPALPPGTPPPTGTPGVPQGLTATASQATFLYCTNWELDPWYGAYYIYACFYDLGYNFQADIYYYYGDASQGAYWFSFYV